MYKQFVAENTLNPLLSGRLYYKYGFITMHKIATQLIKIWQTLPIVAAQASYF